MSLRVSDNPFAAAKTRLTPRPRVVDKVKREYGAEFLADCQTTDRRALLAAELKGRLVEIGHFGTTVENIVEGILQLSTEFNKRLERVAAGESSFRRSSLAPEHHAFQASPSPPSIELLPSQIKAEPSQEEVLPRPPLPPSSPPTHHDNHHPSELSTQRHGFQHGGRNVEGLLSEPQIHNTQSSHNLNNDSYASRKRMRSDVLDTQPSMPGFPESAALSSPAVSNLPVAVQAHTAPQLQHVCLHQGQSYGAAGEATPSRQNLQQPFLGLPTVTPMPTMQPFQQYSGNEQQQLFTVEPCRYCHQQVPTPATWDPHRYSAPRHVSHDGLMPFGRPFPPRDTTQYGYTPSSRGLNPNYNSGIYQQPNNIEEAGVPMTRDEDLARLFMRPSEQ